MDVGQVIAERFELRQLAGQGGMGTVWQALDGQTGELVALKVLQAQNHIDEGRFAREGRLLAQLSHPAIVRYIDHGSCGPAHGPVQYLAMEWLEGEDLAQRLSRRGLEVGESLALVHTVAEGLAAAHQAGIIHRDIKPSNLFLVQRDPRRAKILDFGIARAIAAGRSVTKTGAMLGTLGYVAPEQACGERNVDARADVFSLGCVFFECVTGVPAFQGPQAMAVLAKILFGEIPKAQDVRPDLPGWLDELVGRLMAKEREHRPGHGQEILELLAQLQDRVSLPAPRPNHGAPGLTTGERRFLSVLLISPSGQDYNGEFPTLTPEQLEDTLRPVRHVAEPLGAKLAQLPDGSVLVVLKGEDTAKDLAVKAATAALGVRSLLPRAWVSMATGPIQVEGKWPVGEVIDRVARIQRLAVEQEYQGLCIDDVTAALLETRFDVGQQGELYFLRGDKGVTAARRLLGKPTPCVGRDRELRFLQGLFDDCRQDPAACAVLVTGPAGSGKSRVAFEWWQGAERCCPELTVLAARGDALAAGSAFGMAAQLVRSAAGIHADDPPGRRYRRLCAYLEPFFQGEKLQLVSEFLGEMVHAASDQRVSPALSAARHDARVKNQHLRDAFEQWLSGLCAQGPLALVLDDLHWGDLPSIAFIEHVLRRQADAPFMVLALARPSIDEVFPGLWGQTGLQRLGLGPLKPRAAEQLIHAVLGDDVVPHVLRRTVEQAGGNAFFLEELIRHVAERGSTEFPPTILAMAQSRLERLSSRERRVLRAGSILGRHLWPAAVQRLLGGDLSSEELESSLVKLEDFEIIEPSADRKFAGHREYWFRHDLLRQAAYATLTDNDRVLGHRLAAEWLEAEGEPDPLVLAEHFEQGGHVAAAIPHLARGARVSLEGGHLDAALATVKRGLAHGATGPVRGNLLLVQATRAIWCGELAGLDELTSEALELLPRGSSSWFIALAGLALSGTFSGNAHALGEVLTAWKSFDGLLPATGPVAYAAHALQSSMIFLGQAEESRQICERMEQAALNSAEPDAIFVGYVHLLQGWRSLYGWSSLGEALSRFSEAQQRFVEARHAFSRANAGYGLAVTHWLTGDFATSEEVGLQNLEVCRRHGIGLFERWTSWVHAFVVGLQGRYEEGLASLRLLRAGPDQVLGLSCGLSLATLHLAQGDAASAAAEVEPIVAAATRVPPRLAEAMAVAAATSVAQKQPDQALTRSQCALDMGQEYGMLTFYESMAWQARAEALLALQRLDELQRHLRRAQTWLRSEANALPAETRASYLHHLPANAGLAGLAQRHLPHESEGVELAELSVRRPWNARP
jgi:serine/threonine protein kinase/tetratricopeptide (TPR) repeat protein